jgi:hypothetical protein
MTTAADTDRPMRALAETDDVAAMVAETQAMIVLPVKASDALS